MRKLPLACLAVAASVGSAFVVPAYAQEVPQGAATNRGPRQIPLSGTEFELHTSALHSDNILRTSAAEESGTIYSVGTGIDVNHDGRRLDVIALGTLDWVQYPNDTFDNELLGYFNGTASFDVKPGFFQWLAQESYGEQLVDPFATATPQNLQGVNYFTTGPRVTFNFGDSAALALTGQYSISTNEDHSLDNDRYGGGVALLKTYSQRTHLSLNATSERIEFDDAAAGRNYDLNQYFVQFEGQGGRAQLTGELGYTTIDRGDQGGSSNGLLARLRAARRISSASDLAIYASREPSNGADSFRSRIEAGGSTIPQTVVSTDTFVDTTYGVNWGFERNRTRIELDFAHVKERFDRDIVNDRDVNNLSWAIERRVGPRINTRLSGYFERNEAATRDFHSQETGVTARVEYLFGPSVGMGLQYEWMKRTATDVVSEFTENRIGVLVFYRPMGRARR